MRTAGAFMLLLPIATVWYDNLILGLGGVIGAGAALEALTFPRFVGHALFTPSRIVAATMLVMVLFAGIYVRVKTRGRWPWMLLGALLVPLGQALGNEGPMFIVVNLGEVLMSAAMVATLAYVMRRERAGVEAPIPPSGRSGTAASHPNAGAEPRDPPAS